MSLPCEYVITGGILECDKGIATSNIKCTHCHVKVTDREICNEKDKVVGENIFDFSICKIDGDPCIAVDVTWVNTSKNNMAGVKALVARSYAKCKKGGKITVMFSGQSPNSDDYDPDDPRSVDSFLDLIKKIEEANPDWSQEDVLSALRRLGGVDYDKMRDFFGLEGKGNEIKPKGNLTQNDIDHLRGLLLHDIDDKGNESGIIIDRQGKEVAMAHVLTGLQSGLNPDRSVAVGGFWERGGQRVLGTSLDNIYATTLAGDLGQSAIRVSDNRDVGTSLMYNYIGPGTEATFGELNADIDGFIIGEHLAYKNTGDVLENAWSQGKFSSFMNTYYSEYSSGRYDIARKWSSDEKKGQYIKQQTRKFSKNYGLADLGKWAGLNLNPSKFADEAFQEYQDWLDAFCLSELIGNKVTDGTCK